MTKARLKRFLSVVVALFLFVCSVVVGFSVDDTLVFPYYFPFFTDAHFTFAPSYNPTGFVSWSPSSSDSAPFLSYTYSGSVTSQHLYLFLSQNNKSFTYDTTDILGKPVTCHTSKVVKKKAAQNNMGGFLIPRTTEGVLGTGPAQTCRPFRSFAHGRGACTLPVQLPL